MSSAAFSASPRSPVAGLMRGTAIDDAEARLIMDALNYGLGRAGVAA